VEPFLTTLRGSAAYTIPKVDVLIAATVRSQSGIALSTTLTGTGTLGNGAQWNVPNTVVQQLLGRLPAGALASGTTLVPLIDTDHRLYGPRRNQLDMRFAKIVKYRTTRANVGVDLGNLLNSNQATAYQSQYDYVQPNGGSWLDPTTILQPRFARFSVTFSLAGAFTRPGLAATFAAARPDFLYSFFDPARKEITSLSSRSAEVVKS
jgi:hypothetical protein